MRARSVFERIGGFPRVRLIVSDLYDKILASERLAPFFDGIDMRRLIDHQTKFVAAIMGGPASFSDEQLERSHFRLGITDADFDELTRLFGEVVEDFGLDELEQQRICGHVLSMRDHIVVRPEALTP